MRQPIPSRQAPQRWETVMHQNPPPPKKKSQACTYSITFYILDCFFFSLLWWSCEECHWKVLWGRTGSICDEFTLDPTSNPQAPWKDPNRPHEFGVCAVFWLNSEVFGGVRCEVRADPSILVPRLASCVYRFPLHLLGLRSKCTQGLSTGEPRKEQKKKKKTDLCKEACQHLSGVYLNYSSNLIFFQTFFSHLMMECVRHTVQQLSRKYEGRQHEHNMKIKMRKQTAWRYLNLHFAFFAAVCSFLITMLTFYLELTWLMSMSVKDHSSAFLMITGDGLRKKALKLNIPPCSAC